jgi:hypothetical protein
VKHLEPLPRTVRELYDNLGVSPDSPIISQLPETSVTYMVPLDHFSGTTNNITVVPDTQSVGPRSTLSLQMAHSTMVPHATTIPTGNVVVNQAPIGTPLPSRPIPSLPPGYHALNTSIAIPTQNPSGGKRLFIPPGYNVVVGFVSTPTQNPSGGSYVPLPPLFGGANYPGPSGSNPLGGTGPSITSGFQIPFGGQPQTGAQPQVGGKPQFGAQPQVGGNPRLVYNLNLGPNLNLGGNPKLAPITRFMGKLHLYLGFFLSKEIHNRLGGNILKLTLLYLPISANRIQVP